MYDNVVDQINQKLALKEAMTRANRAIASSKNVSRRGNDDDGQISVFSQPRSIVSRQTAVGEDVRSKQSTNSRLSLVAISQRGK